VVSEWAQAPGGGPQACRQEPTGEALAHVRRRATVAQFAASISGYVESRLAVDDRGPPGRVRDRDPQQLLGDSGDAISNGPAASVSATAKPFPRSAAPCWRAPPKPPTPARQRSRSGPIRSATPTSSRPPPRAIPGRARVVGRVLRSPDQRLGIRGGVVEGAIGNELLQPPAPAGIPQSSASSRHRSHRAG